MAITAPGTTTPETTVAPETTVTPGTTASPETTVPGTTANHETTTSDNKGEENSPQTSDLNLGIWFNLMFISGAAMIAVNIYGKKRRSTNS